MHLPFSSSVFSFCKMLLTKTLLGMRQVSVLVPDQLEDNAGLGKERKILGRASYQFLGS